MSQIKWTPNFRTGPKDYQLFAADALVRHIEGLKEQGLKSDWAEVIDGPATMLVRPYFDLDLKTDEDAESVGPRHLESTLQFLTSRFGVEKADIAVCKATGAGKVSYHLVVTNRKISKQDCKKVAAEGAAFSLDAVPYGAGQQKFRTLYSWKKGRQMVPINFSNDPTKHFVQNCDPHAATFVYDTDEETAQTAPTPELGDDSCYERLPFEQLKDKVLSLTKPEFYDYEIWFKVMCLLKSQCPDPNDAELDEKYLELFDLWSRNDPSPERYDGRKIAREWHKLEPRNQVGLGSLRHWTEMQQPGWNILRFEPVEFRYTSYADFELWFNHFFCRLDKGIVRLEYGACGNVSDYSLFSHTQFVNRYKGLFMSSGDKPKDLVCLWLGSRTAKARSHIGVYTTAEEEAEYGSHNLNVFAGIEATRMVQSPERARLGLQRLLDHIRNALCNGCEENYNYLTRWMASIVQLKQKIGTMVWLLSGQGCGKSVIFSSSRGKNGLFPRLLGLKTWTSLNDIEDLLRNFNAGQEANLLITMEEMGSWRKGHKNWSKLKDLITGFFKRVEPKGVDATTVLDHANLVALSNYCDAVKVEDGDRRMAVFLCSEDYSKKAAAAGTSRRFGTVSERKGYFAQLWADVEDDAAVRAFYDHLVDVDLSDFDPEDIPETSIREELMQYSACPVAKWLADWRAGEPMRLRELGVGEYGQQINEVVEVQWEPGRHFPTMQMFEMFGDYCRRTHVDMGGTAEKDALSYTLRKKEFREYVQAQTRRNRRGWALVRAADGC